MYKTANYEQRERTIVEGTKTFQSLHYSLAGSTIITGK